MTQMTTAEFLDETVNTVRRTGAERLVVAFGSEWVEFTQGGTFKVRVWMDDITCHVILMNQVEVEYGRASFTGSLATPYFVAGAVSSFLL